MPKTPYPGVYVKSGKIYVVLYHNRKTYRAGKSFTNKTEAKKWREEKLRELERGIEIDTNNITVAGFIPYFLSEYTEDTGTHTTYKSHLNTMKKYEIADIKLQNLKKQNVEDFASQLLGDGYHHNTVVTFLRVLRRLCNVAKSEDYEIIAKNPVKQVPGMQKKKINMLTPRELSTLLNSTPDRDAAIFACGSMGIRLSETTGLRKSDINLKRNTLMIDKTFKRKKERPLKNISSHMELPIPEELVPYIKKWYLQTPEGWLFPGKIPNRPLDETSLCNLINKWVKRLDLTRITFHELRHTFITLLLAKGVPMYVAQKYARHASIKTTIDIYGHLQAEHLRNLIGDVSIFMDNQSRKRPRKTKEGTL